MGITEATESYEAARRAREEEKLRQLTSKGPGERQADANQPKGRKGGKDKGAGKGRYEENTKGKKGDGKKDEKPWGKEKK